MQLGMSVTYVAHRADITPSQLFVWKLRVLEGRTGAVHADNDVVGVGHVCEHEKRYAIWSVC